MQRHVGGFEQSILRARGGTKEEKPDQKLGRRMPRLRETPEEINGAIFSDALSSQSALTRRPFSLSLSLSLSPERLQRRI